MPDQRPEISDKRRTLLDEIGQQVVRSPRSKPLLIAVDGVDGAGKTVFASELSDTLTKLGLEVIQSSIDNFHNPKSYRYRRGENSPSGFYEDSFNYEQIKSLVLDPLNSGGNRQCVLSAFDHTTDSARLSSEILVKESAVLVFDGIFLMRPELRSFCDLSIFLRVSFAENTKRTVVRDFNQTSSKAETEEDFISRHNVRYIAGQQMYLDQIDPESLADIVINNENPAEPTLITPTS